MKNRYNGRCYLLMLILHYCHLSLPITYQCITKYSRNFKFGNVQCPQIDLRLPDFNNHSDENLYQY